MMDPGRKEYPLVIERMILYHFKNILQRTRAFLVTKKSYVSFHQAVESHSLYHYSNFSLNVFAWKKFAGA